MFPSLKEAFSALFISAGAAQCVPDFVAPSVSWHQCDKLQYKVHGSLAECKEHRVTAVLTDMWSQIMLDLGHLGENHFGPARHGVHAKALSNTRHMQ